MTVFGKRKEAVSGWDPKLDVELNRVRSLSLPDLAAEVMEKGFAMEFAPGSSGFGIDWVTDQFSASPQMKLRDTTTRAHQQAAREAADPTSERYKWLQLRDTVGEGVQALEKALLINQTSHFTGVTTVIGWVATRAGQEALEQGSVASIVANSTT
jgi:hypothetical protein